MRRVAVVGACTLALSLPAVNASATPLSVGDQYFVGQIIDGTPSSLAAQVDYIANLLTLPAGTPASTCGASGTNRCYTPIGGELYTRVDSTLSGSLPAPLLPGAAKVDAAPNTGINVSGFTYILGKYAASQGGTYVWYVPSLAVVYLPATLGTCGNGEGCALSHYALFNPVPVPDGGATLILLGGAFVALSAFRTMFSP